MTDVRIHDDGSVIGFEPLTPEAKQWFATHVRADAWQWMGPVCWCDWRMAEMICELLAADGFNIGA